ncbi:2-succinyl-6-hydroxy-2,4-cyclohexadiene-1-carboxylate synthase [Chimaeribacter arupi]|uniref:2-succinyl-6-hydroxy-2, 4-cyclohexadiene-1-carboxylate synthase n=1 Tax=Chimaeribacter arupi TaxID=2060066 RepID=UPI002711E89F|nr:2-succinyl-6-hydroxy-2,4-cyclohexadiene-1-carboxylate synthase [Chimaeribacter arupi]WKZ93476.1 2-succinyl-6-hydroxy-2,4-cyclohexadiene-1-carboxylate synthase [Chimaeribacter arupi]
MSLACRAYPAHSGVQRRPWLVFLHGLLGRGSEWQPVLARCGDWPCLTVDLPGHGASAAVSPSGFAALDNQLTAVLRQQNIERYWLVGYSLGGRVAMYHAARQPAGLCGLVVEGSHPGLLHPAERLARLESDRRWAQRFLQQPLPQVLDAWYRQPLFAELTDPQRQGLIGLRSHNQPAGIAQMLLATSLGHQPPFDAALRRLRHPFYCLCGEQDARFRALAEARGLPLSLLPGGHNVHHVHPDDFAHRLLSLIRC